MAQNFVKAFSTKKGATLYYNLTTEIYYIINGTKEDIIKALDIDINGYNNNAALYALNIKKAVLKFRQIPVPREK